MNDTICAISTAQGVGAISIIRVSGDDAIKIVNNIFSMLLHILFIMVIFWMVKRRLMKFWLVL